MTFGYRYSTYFGWVVSRTATGGNYWMVVDSDGHEVARSAVWWKAMRWALAQRPYAGALAAPEPERE